MRSWYLIVILFFTSCFQQEGPLEFNSSGEPNSDTRSNIENLIIKGTAPLGFESLKRYLLVPKCFSCHSGPDALPARDPIDFSTYETTMIGRFIPLLKKGEPLKSRLYKSVLNGDMPPGETNLHEKELQFIYDWILACAPKDPVNEDPFTCEERLDYDDEFFEEESLKL